MTEQQHTHQNPPQSFHLPPAAAAHTLTAAKKRAATITHDCR